MGLISPGVAWREYDFSQYAAVLAATSYGIAGTASKGKVGKVTQLTSRPDIIRLLGKPNPNAADRALYAADQYLGVGSNVKFVRVTDGTHATSTVNVKTSGAVDLFDVNASSPGVWGDELAVEIANVDGSSKTFDVRIKYPDPASGSMVVQEIYEYVTLDPSSSNYIERVINEGRRDKPISEYVEISVVYDWGTGAVVPAAGTTALVGGLDGGTPSASDYAGVSWDAVVGGPTGLRVLENSEVFDINLISVPGVYDATVINTLIDICENIRRDCLAIIDTPPNKPPQGAGDVITWRKGLGISSSYGALYWPWITVDDTYNRVNVKCPPSGFVAQRMAYTDFFWAQWFAPAGYKRGRIVGPLDIEYNASQPQRDLLYDRLANVNAIIKDPVEGYVIWGQRSMQTAPTLLDRVQTRRTLLYLEKVIATSVKYLVFEPNDPVTWKTFINLVDPVFDTVKRGRGISDYKLICDATTTTPALQDRHEMKAVMMLKPIGAAEFITLDFALLSAGAKFE